MTLIALATLSLCLVGSFGANVFILLAIRGLDKDLCHLERRVDSIGRTRDVNRFRFAVESPASDFRQN